MHLFFPGESEILTKIADSARQMALLRSNETIMIRRYNALQESEAIHKKRLGELKEEMLEMESGMMEKFGELQR